MPARLLRRRLAEVAQLTERSVRAEAAESAKAAADAERNRLAREMHDIIGHGVRLMVVHAAAAETNLDDPAMPSVDGIAAIRQIVAAGHRARVLILTTYDLDEHLYDTIRAGACGFILKTEPTPRLPGAIRAAAAGDTVLAPEIARRLLERFVNVQEAVRAVRRSTRSNRRFMSALSLSRAM